MQPPPGAQSGRGKSKDEAESPQDSHTMMKSEPDRRKTKEALEK